MAAKIAFFHFQQLRSHPLEFEMVRKGSDSLSHPDRISSSHSTPCPVTAVIGFEHPNSARPQATTLHQYATVTVWLPHLLMISKLNDTMVMDSSGDEETCQKGKAQSRP